ncbi:HIT family protein [Asanoa sp. NPDC049518]|uniref:HIT family protein n=1 Tax=unclassified Asanoa TaxID=2685164 RepID=UPI00344103F0
MPSVFSMIIAGELPGRFVHRDDRVVAFLSIAPLTQGHTLVVPVAEVDDWTTLDPALWSHLMAVAARIGTAVRTAFDAPRAGLVIAGFEVPHTHVHVFPAYGLADFDFANARHDPPASELDEARRRILAALE